MSIKILFPAAVVAMITSCSTTYKSGQTPDDVYYSPVKISEDHPEKQYENNYYDTRRTTTTDYGISMCIRDRRWRNFNTDFDYRYSPYSYSTCACNNYGYYYNPYYHRWPVYTRVPVNTTPRMVNLNAYSGINNAPVTPKTNNGVNWVRPSREYNNSNRIIRENKTISSENRSSETRTYTPSNNNSSNSSGSKSSSSGSVSRPNRGG